MQVQRLSPMHMPWGMKLALSFGLVVASFITATIVARSMLASVDGASADIANNAAPSIEHLAAARTDIRSLQLALRNYVDEPTNAAPVERARDAMNAAIEEYLKLPTFLGERDLWADILREEDALNIAVSSCLSLVHQGDIVSARSFLQGALAARAQALSIASARAIELNATYAHDLAFQIRDLHDRSTRVAFMLDGLCALLTVAGATMVWRTIRSHMELAERHRVLLEARADELEQFAGRVAHDILSPLSVVSLALNLAGGSDEMRTHVLARAGAAVKRVRSLVDGLLDFAIAGARPEGTVTADVRGVMADLVPDLQAAAQAKGIRFEVDVAATRRPRCNAGVLTSVISNLVNNAIKYIGDGAMKRIDVRVADVRDFVRIEVQDTGPGLPAGLEDRVFEPYVQAKHGTNQSGIGLGLATVKRVVQAHSGRVGVASRRGEGCTFWVELPSTASQ